MPGIVVLVRYVAQPGKAAVALSAIQTLVGQVLSAEPQCGGIEILADADQPEHITPGDAAGEGVAVRVGVIESARAD